VGNCRASNFFILFQGSFLLLAFMTIRWTLPRFRYDQLMDLGWKRIFPISLANLLLPPSLFCLFIVKKIQK